MATSNLASQSVNSPQYSGRNGTTVDTFLIHHQAGTNDDAVLAAMASGSREVSANYTINSAGRITAVIDEDYRAWTSGSAYDQGRGAAWDARSITVEIENISGGPDWPISDLAIRAAALLLNDLRTRYNIVNVLGHKDLWQNYQASYSTFCPGPETVARVVAASLTLQEDEEMPGPLFYTPNTVSFPNGYTTSLPNDAWVALKSRCENPENAGLDWATPWLASMHWQSVDFVIQRQATATAASVIAALKAGGIKISAEVDEQEIAARVIAALPSASVQANANAAELAKRLGNG